MKYFLQFYGLTQVDAFIILLGSLNLNCHTSAVKSFLKLILCLQFV